MFKIVATPQLIAQIPLWGYRRRWLTKGYWLCVDPSEKSVGYIDDHSQYSDEYPELKELNQGVLNQLTILHSLGFTPKEMAEILNE